MRRALVFLVVLTSLAVELPAASLDRTSLPATGRQTALLAVDRFGRFAVTVKSSQGVALQLVDRVAGPGAVSGEPGATDGRVEGFLDHGEYRIVALASEKGIGTATLEAHAFRELSIPKPPMVGLVANVETTLGDFEQRSWWLHVPGRQRIALEAAGRALGDLRLWKDGQWLVDAEPTRDMLEPEAGRPLTVLQLGPVMEPGLYLLTAYGGMPQAWSNDDGRSPLLMRLGMTELAEAGRQRRVMSAFGIDRFVVPGEASFFRIELDESPASLGVGAYGDHSPFRPPPEVETITKETLPPAVEIRTASSPGTKTLVTITAPPGKAYVLQHFDSRERQYYSRNGRYWVATVHSGAPVDSADVTTIVTTTQRRPDDHIVPIVAQVIELGSDAAWARRFNLLEETTLFFHVKEAGEYEVEIAGVDARCRFEPYLIDPSDGYESPKLRGSGSTWDLDVGWHVLTLVPESIGIAEVAVRKAGLWEKLLSFIGREKEKGLPPLRPAAQFPEMQLQAPLTYFLHMNHRPGIEGGLVLRSLPIDLSKALPISLFEGETLTIPVRVGEPSSIRAELEDGTTLPLSLDGAAPLSEADLPADEEHRVTLAAPGSGGPRILSLVAVPMRERQPLPELPADLEPKPLDLPVLLAGTPQFFDLDRDEARTFLVRADEGGLYRLESTGLLATEGNLRNRVVTSLARSSAGGTGRNFLVQQAVQSGDYQLTIKALGRSKGHAGLSLARTKIDDGGTLEDGVQENATLPSGQGIAYDLVVSEPSTWHLRAFAQGRTLRCRFEEEGGWPLETPGGAADITRKLEPGRYRFVVLPEPVQARIAVIAERVKEPVKREGHGPFELAIDEMAEHVWLESPEGAERVPDRWTFTMPATSEATITLGNGMEGSVMRASDEVARLRPGRPWTGELGTGEYAILVTAPRRDNRRAYTVQVRPKALMAGMSRTVVAPAEIEVAVDSEFSSHHSPVEIRSFGTTDVKARILNADGFVEARSDDAPDDWNFRFPIVKRARRLVVEPVGGGSATTTVAMSAIGPSGGTGASVKLTAPGKAKVLLERGRGALLQIDVEREDALLVVSAMAAGPVTLSAVGSGSSAAGRPAVIAIPIHPTRGVAKASGPVRVSIHLMPGRGGKQQVDVSAVFVQRRSHDVAGLGYGIALERIGGVDGDIVVGAFSASRPGLLDLQVEGARDARWGERGLVPLMSTGHVGWISDWTSWLVASGTGKGGAMVRGKRLALRTDGHPLMLKVPEWPLACDVAQDSPKSLVLVVAEAPAGDPAVCLGPDIDACSPRAVWTGGSASAFVGAPVSAWVRRASLHYRDLPALAVRLSAFEVSPEVVESTLPTWSATADEPRAYRLASGPKRVRMTLAEGTFAVLSDESGVRSVHGAVTRPWDESLDTTASKLHVLKAGGAGHGAHAVEIHASGGPERALRAGVPIEIIPSHAGTVNIPVESDGKGRIYVQGSRSAQLVMDRLTQDSGAEFPSPKNGTLLIETSTTPVGIRIQHDSALAEAWGNSRLHSSASIEGPASVELAGSAQSYGVRSSAPSLLSLRTSHPVVVRLRRDGEPPVADAWPTGARLDAWLPTGKAEIDLRGFASAQLAGTASISLTSAEALREGPGDETLIPAGSARAYTFTLSDAATIGIGVRGSTDAIDVELLDAHGDLLGSGIVQMPKLETGTYVLVVMAPADGPPVTARPALVGVELPGLGPSEDIIRAFVEGREAAPAAAAPIPPGWERWLGAAQRSGWRQPEEQEQEEHESGEGD